MIPYAREIGAVVILAAMAGSGWLGWEWRDRSADAEMATIVAHHATALAEAQERARDAERRQAQAIADIAEQYERDKADAQAAADRVAADLRAGNVRLRDHWAGCETSRVSGDATAARLADEAARLRAESASRVVQAADEADAQVRGLQRVIESVR